MPYPKSLQQPFRPGKLVIGAGWRAFFAPYNKALGSSQANTSVGPHILDLTTGPFDSYSPPSGFSDLGWIKDFKVTVESKIGQVRSGYRGAVRAQYRGQVGESFEMKFREYGRLQYRLATGTNVMNILGASGQAGGTAGPISASGAASTAVSAYSVSNGVATLTVTSAAAAQVAVGDYIVCDQDYTVGQFGLQGDAGTPVFQGAVTDVDYIRKNSDYVGRVTSIPADTTIILDQPFVGGGSGNPAPNFTGSTFTSFTGVKVQKVKGFVAREGGTYVSEWSCLLMCNTIDAAQLVIYYPHVSILQLRDHAAPWTIENAGTTDESGMEMDAQFTALAYDDPLDGETVVAYKGYYARPGEQFAY